VRRRVHAPRPPELRQHARWRVRLRATIATRHSWRRRRPVELGRVVIHLAAHGSPAFGTDVVVLVAGRQNEQELPPRWGRAATPWAEEAGRLELGEAVGTAHTQILRTGRSRDQAPLSQRLGDTYRAFPATLITLDGSEEHSGELDLPSERHRQHAVEIDGRKRRDEVLAMASFQAPGRHLEFVYSQAKL